MVNGPEDLFVNGPPMDERIDWRACKETVRRLRGRIFTAAQEENSAQLA
jgi:hypothetical protein